MLRFDVITLFPDLYSEYFKVLPFNRALDKQLTQIKLWNLRDYADSSYKSVDDKPFGGGVGMIIKIEPVYKALIDIYSDYYSIKPELSSFNNGLDDIITRALNDPKVIISVLSPKGEKFKQNTARDFCDYSQITLICGRYEGIDQRIIDNLSNKNISVGDYILAGGETASLAVMEAVLRVLPGILDITATQNESFSENCLEHPQYTRPEVFKGLKVPEILLSGDHKLIAKWKKENSPKLDSDKL